MQTYAPCTITWGLAGIGAAYARNFYLQGNSLTTPLATHKIHLDTEIQSMKITGHVGGLVRERGNSSALAMELRPSRTNPSMW